MPPVSPQRFGRFLLLEPLGRGASGDVHLARPIDRRGDLPALVVIKRLLDRLAEDEEHSRRFRHEAALAVKVDSPHIAKVYEAGSVGDTLYIALEHVEGWPLSHVLDAMVKHQRRPTIASAVAVVLDLLDALTALHGARDPRSGAPLGIVHRDVSPKNIMIGEDGRARLIDLGLGKSAIQDWRTATGIVMGTVGYMPPEQIGGERVDQRADLYAAAAVLYELITLEHYIERGPLAFMVKESLSPRYRAPTISRPEVPEALVVTLKRALAVDKEQRFASAAEFATALRRAAPTRSSGDSLALLARELLGGELEEARTQVTRLASLKLEVEEDTEVHDRTVVYAMRTAVTQEKLPVKRSGRAINFVAMAAMLVAGILIGRVLLAPEPEARVVIEEAVPSAKAPPRIVSRPEPEAAVAAEPAREGEPEAVAPARTAPPKTKTVSPRPETKAPSEAEPASPSNDTPGLEKRRASLIARVKALQSSAAPEHAAQLKRILGQLVLETGTTDPERAKETFDRLDAELDALSASAGSK